MTYTALETGGRDGGGKRRPAPDVVVVGGGFAGLSAAVRLADAGRRVLVLEARARLGGRATAFVDRDTGELVDNGQHVMFGCYRETLAFLDLIGARDNVRIQPTLSLPFIAKDGRRSTLTAPAWPPPLHLLGGILRWTALPLRDRLAALRLAAPILRAKREPHRPDHEQAVAPSVREWLLAHGQTPAIIDTLWEPLAVAALNQPIDDAAAPPFVRVLAEMFGRDASAAALVLPTRPLDQMYAEPARAFIEARGGAVRTDALARIILGPDGPAAVEVRTTGRDASAQVVRIPARHVVAAVPWHALRNLLPDPPAVFAPAITAAAAIRSMPIVTVNLWYDRVVMQDPFVGLTGRTIQWIFDKRQVFGEQASHLSLVVSAAESLAPESREALIEIAARDVADALPGAAAARLVRATVVRERQATFSLSPGEPARPSNATVIPGFVLAGDWTDTGLPGTIESAVMSGRAAAGRLLGARG